jgi:DNA-binding beta-propeller fold protein YncE
LRKVGNGEWEAKFKNVPTPAHQAGYSPDGNHFVLMNNSRENIMAVFDSSNQKDPTSWRRVAGVGDRSWRGAYPNPFHMAFTPDISKMYVTLWWPPPTKNSIAVVDTRSWKITKVIEIGPDTHTIASTGDGKWLFGVYSGYQKTNCGTYVVRIKDDKFYGYLPSPYGHHDSVIVPRSKKELAISRCPTT